MSPRSELNRQMTLYKSVAVPVEPLGLIAHPQGIEPCPMVLETAWLP